MAEELNNAEYLRDLAERLMHIPVMYGTDQDDVFRLYRVAQKLDDFEKELRACTTR